MKYKFLGTPEQPDEITLRGVVFERGKSVDVTDPNFAAKLANLDYFSQAKAGRPKKHDKNGE